MSSTTKPNLLFLFPDQWRWDWLGVHDGSDTPYGKIPVNTPNIDRLAARGVRFTQCRTNSPVCSPARSCVAQGKRYESCGTPSNAQYTPRDTPTVYRMLRDAGYHTATCGKSDLFKPDQDDNPTGFLPIMAEYGFTDGIDHRGKGDAIKRAHRGIVEPYTQMLRENDLLETHLDDHPPDTPLRRAAYATPLPNDSYTDDFCGQNGLKLLARAPQDKPWMLWVNFPGPHDPFDPPADMLRQYEGIAFPPPVCPTDNPPTFRDNIKDRPHYAACCSNIDAWVGKLIAHIEARGELNNTVIIFASDHGEMLGDHGQWTKTVPQEGSVHVPLIIAGPGMPEGQTCDDLVELIDISATMLAAAGLDVDPGMDARPVPQLGGKPRDIQLSSLGDWKSVVNKQYKLVVYKTGETLLFDLINDAGETNNLAQAKPDVVERLKVHLPAFG